MAGKIDKTSLEAYFTTNLQEYAPAHHLKISAATIDYLAHTLAGFLRSEALFRTFRYGPLERNNSLEPLTMLSRAAHHDGDNLRRVKAQLVGNECLFLVSFFYEYLLQKCGEGLLKYHAQLGSGSYQQAAQLSADGQVFSELARNFWEITDVVRDVDRVEPHKHLLLERHRRHLLGEAINFN